MRIPPQHQALLDIVFGRVDPRREYDIESLPLENVNTYTLMVMERLVKIEFNASLQKELENVDESAQLTQANPFDVYLVEPTFRNKNIHIAVAVPVSKNVLAWYDENDVLWDIRELVATRKVSSLSGTARVLENLTSPTIPTLMRQAMDRTNMFDASSLASVTNEDTSIAGLNMSQNAAVLALKSRTFDSGFFVVQGPPGTGKSTTMVEMILAADQRVIASAPSNAATANIALKLFNTAKFHLSELCVYGHGCIESVHFLNPTLRKERFATFLKKIEDENDEKKSIAMLREFCAWLHLSPESSIEDVFAVCSHPDYYSFGLAKVVCCTLNSSGSEWLRQHTGKRETFFLDEAGQCNEAEFYLATAFPRVSRIVVVGDPQQLPPTTIDRKCKEAGFGTSWMERIQLLCPSKVHLLDTQYRMDPLILKFPNQEFYGNRIKSGECVRSRSPAILRPVGFVDTSNRSCEERENFSTINTQEASIIRALLRQDEDIQTLLRERTDTQVVVITPYTAQANLLISELKKVKGLDNWSVSTVDSYQGQEADIVIISTVRTERIGFVDDKQRLNVALTRAKRLVRIVGNKKLFDTLGRLSTLRKLTTHLCNQKYGIDVNVKNTVFSLPDWRKPSLWKPTFTQRFHNSLRSMTFKQKAVTFTTLQAVTTPNLRALHQRPTNGYWHVSSLPGHSGCSIVWVAKHDYTIEAHLAGAREDCLSFIQKNIATIPMGSCRVKPDMSGVRDQIQEASSVTPSWDLTNFLQRAIENDAINELPEGSFHLDPEQQAIVSSCPPLLLESRSGTGKTNVLFQHAISLSQELVEDTGSMPLAFITVSKLLRSQLEKMYSEIKNINKAALQSCIFMSLSDLLDGLAKRMDINMDISTITSFKEYAFQRKSHASLPVSLALVENEIGGVILGSLRSAELRRPLNWDEYKDDRRSNVTNKDGAGSIARRVIYDQYEFYDQWKRDCDRFDINDVVLELLKKVGCKKHQIFSGVYLDEIQDFSYAMIYLICSIGGTSKLRWVFAGDTAQMISPGCSFKFSGLKQTLLSVRPGIEPYLKQVAHLLVNYRTTKDVLQLGNAILAKAKKHYPGAIEFARKEQAVHDFGIKVVLNDWDSALATKPSFGKDQALICSFSKDHEDSYSSLKHWLGDHPFILSALDSKGLEFDDVVVAFDLDRTCWKVDSQGPDALNMLRELYVAVTRAKRRVVILVKKRSDTMLNFFSSLEYGLHHCDPEKLFRDEFNTCTSKDQWLLRADDLFEEERYLLASRCYEKAESPAFAAWARGRHFAQERSKEQATRELLRTSRFFFELSDYRKVLEIASEMLGVVSWDEEQPNFISDELLDASEAQHPNYLSHSVRLNMDVFRDTKWNRISLEDIEKEHMVISKRRGFPGLIAFLQHFSDLEIQRVAKVIPCLVGDLLYSRRKFVDAIDLYLIGSDFPKAEEISVEFVHFLKKNKDPIELLQLADMWVPHMHCLSTQKVRGTLPLLFSLIDDPEKAAETHSSQCLDKLGRHAIKFIVDDKGLDPTHLHAFCQNSFHEEVLKELKRNHKGDPESIVTWFLSRGDREHAMDFILDKMSKWEVQELKIFLTKGILNKEVAQEFFNRGLYFDATNPFIRCGEIDKAFTTANHAVLSVKGAEMHALKIMHLLQGVTKPKHIPHRVMLLTKLFHQPEKLDKKMCEEIMKNFGPSVVQEFVLRRSSYSTVGKVHSKEVQVYLDVLDVLAMFGNKAKMPRRAVLDIFQKRKIFSNSFVDFHLTNWARTDLFDLVDKFGYRNKSMAAEFHRRGFYTKAAELFLGEKRHNDAVKASENALSVPRLACRDATEVRRLWLTKTNASRHSATQNTLSPNSHLHIFLLLCQSPEYVATCEDHSITSACARCLDSSVIRDAVLASYVINPQKFKMDPVDILQRFNQFDGKLINISKLDVLRELNAVEDSREKVAVQHYAKVNIKFWSLNMRKLSNEDIHILLDVEVHPSGIQQILEKRKMYAEVVELYLENGSDARAISISNLALDEQNLEKYAVSLVDVWDKALENYDESLVENIPSNSKLWLLLHLFWDPALASESSDFGSQCISTLGPQTVEVAVLKKYPPEKAGDLLRAFDLERFARYGKKDKHTPKPNTKGHAKTKKRVPVIDELSR